jgi:hypothetical protein
MVQPSNKRFLVEADRGAASGIAPLDNAARVPLVNLPAFTKSILASDVQASLTKADASLPASQKGAVNGVATLGPDAKVQESSLSADVVSKLNGGSGTGGGGGADTTKYAIGRIRGGMRTRDQKPVVFIFDGSSTTAGTNASSVSNRFVNKLATLTQTAYPQSAGTTPEPVRSLSQAVSAKPLVAGVQFINNGLVGSTSADFISSADMATYAALNPSGLTVIHHMVGLSDWSSGVAVATFKTNLAAKVNQIKAAFGSQQLVQVIATSYGRPDSTATNTVVAQWTDYMAAMKEISDADYTNVSFIDVSSTFYASGVPGADPFDLVDSDNVALNDRGHDLMTDLLREGLRIPLVASGTPTPGSSTPTPTPSLANTTAPTITGNAAQGSQLTASSGSWNVTPSSYTYQWRSGGVAVSGATSATFNTRSADIGKAMSVVVTAALDGYNSASSTSNTITVTEAPATTLINSSPPVISGTPQVGNTLSASNGAWNVTPTSYTYQWKRNGNNISGATAFQYALTASDVGSNSITVTVTALRSGYTSGSATSSAVSVSGALTGTQFTSDSFDGSAVQTMAGQSTNAALGGSSTVWGSAGETGLASFGKNGAGRLVPGGNPINATLAMQTPSVNHRVEWNMASISSTSATVWLDFRRTAPQYSASTYRLALYPSTNQLQLVQRASGTTPVGSPISVDVTQPHTYMAEANGTQLRVWIDGLLVQDVADSVITQGPLCGITTTAGSVYSLDSIKVWSL